MKQGRHRNDELRNAVRALRDSGLTYKEIGEQLHISGERARQLLQAQGHQHQKNKAKRIANRIKHGLEALFRSEENRRH